MHQWPIGQGTRRRWLSAHWTRNQWGVRGALTAAMAVRVAARPYSCNVRKGCAAHHRYRNPTVPVLYCTRRSSYSTSRYPGTRYRFGNVASFEGWAPSLRVHTAPTPVSQSVRVISRSRPRAHPSASPVRLCQRRAVPPGTFFEYFPSARCDCVTPPGLYITIFTFHWPSRLKSRLDAH